jgi:hypothetical protein
MGAYSFSNDLHAAIQITDKIRHIIAIIKLSIKIHNIEQKARYPENQDNNLITEVLPLSIAFNIEFIFKVMNFIICISYR